MRISVVIVDGKLEGYLLERKSLGADVGAEMVSSNGRSYGKGDINLEGFSLEEAFGSEVGTAVGASNGIPGSNNSGKLERYPLGILLVQYLELW